MKKIRMQERNFELMVITPEEDFPDEVRWVNRLFAGGLGTLHLRKPGRSCAELLQYLKGVEEPYHSRIMVHYQEGVRKNAGVKGIHYRFQELPAEKPAWGVSCGLHSWEEYRRAAEKVDYALLSPFFNSISKAGYQANPDLQIIPEGINREKVIALGGIQPENIRRIMELNIKGAAVLGYIWQNKNPLKAFYEVSGVGYQVSGLDEN